MTRVSPDIHTTPLGKHITMQANAASGQAELPKDKNADLRRKLESILKPASNNSAFWADKEQIKLWHFFRLKPCDQGLNTEELIFYNLTMIVLILEKFERIMGKKSFSDTIAMKNMLRALALNIDDLCESLEKEYVVIWNNMARNLKENIRSKIDKNRDDFEYIAKKAEEAALKIKMDCNRNFVDFSKEIATLKRKADAVRTNFASGRKAAYPEKTDLKPSITELRGNVSRVLEAAGYMATATNRDGEPIFNSNVTGKIEELYLLLENPDLAPEHLKTASELKAEKKSETQKGLDLAASTKERILIGKAMELAGSPPDFECGKIKERIHNLRHHAIGTLETFFTNIWLGSLKNRFSLPDVQNEKELEILKLSRDVDSKIEDLCDYQNNLRGLIERYYERLADIEGTKLGEEDFEKLTELVGKSPFHKGKVHWIIFDGFINTVNSVLNNITEQAMQQAPPVEISQKETKELSFPHPSVE